MQEQQAAPGLTLATVGPPNEAPALAYSIPDAARCIALSPRTLYEMVERREISYVRIGRRIVIMHATLVDYLAAREVQAVANG